MENQVVIRPRQQILAPDFMSMQQNAQDSFDHIVKDMLVNGPGYSGLTVTATGAAQVSVAAGRYANGEGAIFASSEIVQNLQLMLPGAAKKLVALVVYAPTPYVDTDIAQRKFRINVETNQVEPDDVPMRRARLANVSFLQGIEDASPQLPAIGAQYLHVATITLTTTGVESVAMIEDNRMPNLDVVEALAKANNTQINLIMGLFTTLRSDIAALAARLAGMGSVKSVRALEYDVARLKERANLSDTMAYYGADQFLDETESDTANVADGYNARIENGLRFATDAANETSIQLFNPLETRVKVANGWCVPDYDAEDRLTINGFAGDVSFTSYQQVAWVFRRWYPVRARLWYGASYLWGSSWFYYVREKYDRDYILLRRPAEVWFPYVYNPYAYVHSLNYWLYGVPYFWFYYPLYPYWDRVVTTHGHNGATIAQTFMNAQAGYSLGPRVGFTSVGASGDVTCLLVETTNGAPDVSKMINSVTLTPAQLKKYPQMTHFAFPPTYLEPGKRYAWVFVSQGAHRLAIADKNRYAAGTLAVSTDGAWFEPELDKDLLIEMPFCKFKQSRIEVDLASLSLSGGFSDIDMLYGSTIPDNTELRFEIQPQGSSDWTRLDDPGDAGSTPLHLLPPLCKLRAVFIGSADAMPSFELANSVVKVWRSKTAMKHISTEQTLAAATTHLEVSYLIEGWDVAYHTATLSLLITGVGAYPADVVADEVIPAENGLPSAIKRTATFTPVASFTQFKAVLTMGTTSALHLASVSERVHQSF